MAKSKKLRAERTAQLEKAKNTLEQLQVELRTLRKKAKSREALANHLVGFYNEIDKLAKGRSLIEATPLVVDQANDIIRDAKQIVENDVYLDRIKEFVPAGNNPVYPDVLVTIRVVRQSLYRCGKNLEKQEERILGALTKARTVVGALECFLSGEESSEFALKEDVERYVVGNLDDSCFYANEDAGQDCFDFDDLDSQSVEQYIRKIEDSDEDGVEQTENDAIGIEELDDEQGEEE